MKSRYFASVLDSCVLAPMPIADTLLRLAENDPPFYRPLWSQHILDEVKNTLIKFGYTEAQAMRRILAMCTAFPEALVTGYESSIAAMTNDPKDRHVLAAAVRAGADCIVTYNIADFPRGSLDPFGIECITTDEFLMDRYNLDPGAFVAILEEQAGDISRTLDDLIALLGRHVPKLAGVMKT